MRVLICIDDTDSLDKKIGTGELAERIAEAIEERGWGKSSRITRHQLLLHEDIPYTSHNSSMCFEAEIAAENIPAVTAFAADLLERESEAEADPGLCVAVVEDLAQAERLIQFGFRAKRLVLTKEAAYDLARALNIHLSEHGGTGIGVIGALAGAGLRLSGNDGRFKGKLKLGDAGQTLTVAQIRGRAGVDEVREFEGASLDDSDKVTLSEQVKAVLLGGKSVILAQKAHDEHGHFIWQTCAKDALHALEDAAQHAGEDCPEFQADVEEETVFDGIVSCYDCRFRRWTAKSFQCMNERAQQPPWA